MKVLVADELSPEGLEILRSTPEISVEVKVGLAPAALKAIVGEYDVLAVRSATKVTADVLENPGRLKLIGRAGVGVDNIDVAAATRKGVVVMNTPGGNSVAVAELTIGLMLTLLRQLVPAISATRSGKWEKKRFAGGHELFRKTVGLVGFGSVGQIVAQRCIAFGTTVVAYDPHPVEASRRLGVQILPLEDLFRRADIVSLHVPLMDNTRNLVSRSLLGVMRKGSYLVNCARGGIVDEAALPTRSATARWPERRWTSSPPSRCPRTTRCSRWRTSSPPRTSAPRPRRGSWPARASSPSSWWSTPGPGTSARAERAGPVKVRAYTGIKNSRLVPFRTVHS
jgi:D-3-phosphoglycerate dehydrogenase/(S)-sulfolactate dehydrogenase